MVYMCIEGKAELKMNDGNGYTIEKGETILVPSSMEDFLLIPQQEGTLLLETHMPQLEDEPDLYLNYDEPEDEEHGSYKDSADEDECSCGEHHHSDEHGHHHHHHGCSCGCSDEEGDDDDDFGATHPGEAFFRK